MISITDHPEQTGSFLLRSECELNRPIDQVFEFFSDPFQLENITPPWMKFRVVTPAPINIEAGTLIDYRLQMYGIPFRWRSEITKWQPGVVFVDEQVKGPYRYWRHEHTFESNGEMTIVRDKVAYAVPGGKLAHRLFVQGNIEKIFEFRTSMLQQLFDTKT